MGESMGGAVALLVHRKKPEFWDGAVLVAPMCKVFASNLFPRSLWTSLIGVFSALVSGRFISFYNLYFIPMQKLNLDTNKKIAPFLKFLLF